MTKKINIFVFILLNSFAVFAGVKSNFTLWQLPSQINTIGNSYVFQMNNGSVAVMDGGVKEKAISTGLLITMLPV